MKYCLFVRKDLAELKEDFFDRTELHGMKSDTYMYKELRTFLATKGIDLNTQYLNPPEECEVIICLNETSHFVTYKRQKLNRLMILILTEPPVYNSVDWTEQRHTFFDKVLSYDSDLLKRNASKYVHINFPIDLSVEKNESLPNEADFKKRSFASLVAGAISITRAPSEVKSLLYERYSILKWYNRHKPDALDFFSRTSPLGKFEYFSGASILNKVFPQLTKSIASILFNRRLSKVYKGSIPGSDKHSVLSKYKFHFCLENSRGIKGLISEKVFDCFMSQTVPIYYGAPDITQYIPNNCFILYSDFKTIKDLDTFLKQMDYKTWLQYLVNAGKFLESAGSVFSTRTFVERIYNEIK